MRKATAFAPGHLTGFFQIWDHPKNKLEKGSRGCGASVTQGVQTTVKVTPADENNHTVKINNELTMSAMVSENVLSKLLGYADQSYEVHIRHQVETPFGAGFGSSGGGAISLALALNEAIGLGLSFTKAAQIAHVAEIECKTGLGTVFAAIDGGFGVLVKAGGPGFGEGVFFDRPSDLALVYLHFGPMETSKALSDPEIRARINKLGGNYIDTIKEDLRPDLFMDLARKFTDFVDIKTSRLSKVFDKADKQNIPCTMAMFGEVAFSLVYKEEACKVASFFREAAPSFRVDTVNIDDDGTRLL